MDSEHRHQLQQNDLGNVALKVVPWVERYGNQLVLGTVVFLVVVVGSLVWWSTSTSAASAAWTRLSSATTVEQFGDIVDRYPGTLAAAWAQVRSGELNLESGLRAMFTDRELALNDLKEARTSFDQVLATTAAIPDSLRERAMLGLARTLETTCDGDTAPVISAYETILSRFPNSVYKPGIEQRIADLKKDSARDFYAWFQQQTPKPAPFPRPQDGAPAGLTTPAGGLDDFPPAAAPPLKNPTTSAADAAPAKDENAAAAPSEPPKADESGKTESGKTDAGKPAAEEKTADQPTEKPAEPK